MEENKVEKRFNEWFTMSYDRLRNIVRRYGALNEDNFHDTYLFVRKQVLTPGKKITDYDAYFIGCYKKTFLAKIRQENKYTHPEESFFLRCGEDADFLFSDDLNSGEKLVKDILNFIRRKFPYEEYKMFTLRFYESNFSFKTLGECMGISATTISNKIHAILDAVRSHKSFSWRSQMLVVESSFSQTRMYYH